MRPPPPLLPLLVMFSALAAAAAAYADGSLPAPDKLKDALDTAQTAYDTYKQIQETKDRVEGVINGLAGLNNLTGPGLDNTTNLLDIAVDLTFGDTWALLDDPNNRASVMAAVLAAGFMLAVAGYRLLSMWLFLAGFIASAFAFFVFAPSLITTTACCGPGTELTRAVLSAGIGICGGLLALFVLKMGLFLTGSCLGILMSMIIMSTPLGSHPFLTSPGGFALLYFGLAMLGGSFALWFQKPFIVLTTSIGGAFVMCLALDFFMQTNFNRVVVEALNYFSSQTGAPINHTLSIGGYFLFAWWLGMSCAGALVQYKVSPKAVYMFLRQSLLLDDGEPPPLPKDTRPKPNTVLTDTTHTATMDAPEVTPMANSGPVVVVLERERQHKKKSRRRHDETEGAARADPSDANGDNRSHFALTATSSGLWSQLTGRGPYVHVDDVEAGLNNEVFSSSDEEDSDIENVNTAQSANSRQGNRREVYREKAALYKLRLLELQTRLHEAALVAASQPIVSHTVGALGLGTRLHAGMSATRGYIQMEPAVAEDHTASNGARIIEEVVHEDALIPPPE